MTVASFAILFTIESGDINMNVTYSKSELKQQIEDSTFEVSKDLISEFSLWLAEYLLMNLYDDRED